MIAAIAAALLAFTPAPADPPLNLDECNVVWTTPGKDASGSMPLGNGVVGVNAWVEEGGDLCFYISRVDAWSECERLLKLGRIRVSMDPPLFSKPGASFRQELRLRDGEIAISTGEGASHAELLLYVERQSDVIVISGRSPEPVHVSATLENWRQSERTLDDPVERQSSWAMRDAPSTVPREMLTESADVTIPAANAVAWFHRNTHSIVPFTNDREGLTEIRSTVPDPLLDRTSGGWMVGESMVSNGPGSLRTASPANQFALRIAAHSEQTSTPEEWARRARELAEAPLSERDWLRNSLDANRRWWREFWARSWIIASTEASPAREECELITRAYTLQRYISACASRGDFPIKFNGSIFTVEPRFTEGQPFNADWRKWGGSFWWQNTRLPYYPMLAAGDFDGMNSLFSFYERCLPACRARAKLYYNADGVYFPETMTTFATYANGDYGWNRDGLDRSDISPCPWWQWAWQQGLELSQLMLDYAAYTGDDAFLRERAIPTASESLRYYDSRFARDDRGKLIIAPTQSVETYWKGVVNDAPSVAGLHAICDMLLALPEDVGSPDERALWKRMKAASPDLPVMTRDGSTQCAPAERFDPQRSNCETPELYSLFPFRLYGVGRPNLDHALAAYRNRQDKATHGWTQDGMFAAMLGLTDEAKSNLLAKCRNTNRNFRFPAMWGPNFDWLPDQCHGGNLMTTTQLMLMQCYDDKVYLLPAWPREWNVSFKLHAPRQTTVECVYRNGAIQSLVVTPESRRKDIVLPQR